MAAAFVVGFALVFFLVAYLSYTRFYRYQSEVDRFISAIPAEDRAISAEAKDVFEKLDGKSMTWIATKCLLQHVAPARVSMSEWHVRGAIWELLLPVRVPHDDILAVYTHCMHTKEAEGISGIAGAMYGKHPIELTVSEAIGIVAVTRQPAASPSRNPERFRQNVDRLMLRYNTP